MNVDIATVQEVLDVSNAIRRGIQTDPSEAFAIALAGLAFAASALELKTVVKLIQYRTTLHQILLGAGLAAAGWLVMGLHLKFLDPLLLRYGALAGKPNRPKQSSGGQAG